MYVISDSCISCGTCADGCPMSAIEMNDMAGHYVISDACIDCGSCADSCPTGCISPGD